MGNNNQIFAPFIDLTTFDLNLGINVNLVRYLNKQPIRLSAKSISKNIPFFVIEFDLIGMIICNYVNRKDEHGRGLDDAEIESPIEGDLELEKPEEAHIEQSEEELNQRVKDLELNNE